jgi:hypothetical protein
MAIQPLHGAVSKKDNRNIISAEVPSGISTVDGAQKY